MPSKRDVQSTLRDGGRSGADGRGRRRLRSVLVVAELALAMLLLVGSGLLIATFGALRQHGPGFLLRACPHDERSALARVFSRRPRTIRPFNSARTWSRRWTLCPGSRIPVSPPRCRLGFGKRLGQVNIDVQGHAPATSLDQVPGRALSAEQPRIYAGNWR